MSTPLAYARRKAKDLRVMLHSLGRRTDDARRIRNLIARDLLAPHGPFRPKAKPSRKRPSRHPRHRQRFLADAMA